jgi:PAS domain S-box-containing protein
MKDQSKTKQSLIQELASLKEKIAELEKSKAARKKLDETLRESEDLFRSYLEYAPDGVYMSDLKGTFLYGNRKCEEIIGYRREELIGKNFLELNLLTEKSLNKAIELLQFNMAGNPTGPDEIELISKEGRIIPVEINTSLVQRMGQEIILAFVRNITERKHVEKKLRESEANYRQLFDNSPAAIYQVDFKSGRFLKANDLICEYIGCSQEEITSLSPYDLLTEQSKKLFLERLEKIALGVKVPETVEYEVIDKKGKRWFLQLHTKHIYDAEGHVVAADVVAHDITERKQAEEMLKESENKYRLLADNIQDVVFVMDMNLNYTYLSPSVKVLRGYEPEEAMKHTPEETVTPSSMDLALRILSEMMEIENSEHRDINISRTAQLEMSRKDGTTVWVETKVFFMRDENQQPIGIMGVTRDIAARKQMEDTLLESEIKYRTILEEIQEGYFEVDLAGNLTFFNDSLCRFFDSSKEELKGMNYRQYTTDKGHSKELFKAFNKVYNTGEPIEGFDWQIIRKDGTKRYVEASISLRKDSSGRPIGFRGIARDVTEQRKSEEQYRFLADNMTEHVWLMDLNTMKMTYVSPSVEKIYGYTSDEILKLPFKNFLTAESFLKVLDLLSNEMPKILSNPLPSVHKYSLELEVCHKDGHLLWIEDTLSFLRDENGKPAFILGETREISERKRAEEKLKEILESLRKAIKTTIQVLGTATEARDPYTAGHQKKVADLARVIATEMGFPLDTIEGIRMAGSIHDIGKISIPSEILSKPTKLAEIEFALIKEHARSGFEMLKDVESPWPLAEIVYQHHERMNGSGYPRNLKGDEIIMESRVLAVADVVEAMASHRPYRPTLGIEAALEEIEKNKGILYDNTVADACLRLFREKRYQLT